MFNDKLTFSALDLMQRTKKGWASSRSSTRRLRDDWKKRKENRKTQSLSTSSDSSFIRASYISYFYWKKKTASMVAGLKNKSPLKANELMFNASICPVPPKPLQAKLTTHRNKPETERWLSVGFWAFLFLAASFWTGNRTFVQSCRV